MIRVCSAGDIARGTVVSADIDGTRVAVVHGGDGAFYAIYDECSHERIALSEGEVDGCTLECWLHGSRFDLSTGASTGPPATEPVPVYPVEVHEGDIYVDTTSGPPAPPGRDRAGQVGAGVADRSQKQASR